MQRYGNSRDENGSTCDEVRLLNSSDVGFDCYCSGDAAADRLLLRLSLQDLLEEAQGQRLQKGTQERGGFQKRPDTGQHSEGQGLNKMSTYSIYTV